MKNVFILIVVGLGFYGCCGKVDCYSGEYLKFRLLNKLDSTNLLFCNTQQYQNAYLLLYSSFNNKTDTLFRYTSYDYYKQNFCDSLIEVSLTNPYSKIYIRLNANTTDSFGVTYNFYNSKCCGSGFSIEKFRYNENFISRDSTYTFTLYK